MKRNVGFTLIELLVVISIIALLVSILMPALGLARKQATMAVCVSNQKSLGLSYTMYAGDNDDLLVIGYVNFINQDNNAPWNRYAWCRPPLVYNGATQVDTLDDNVTLESRQNGIKAGKLFKYNESVDVYHCPGDNRLIKGTSLGSSSRYQIFRSYSLPDNLSTYTYENIKRITSIKNPAESFVFVEDGYDGQAANFCHGGWSMYFDTAITGDDYALWDNLGLYHGDAATFSFADGHAESHKWESKDTIAFFANRDDPTLTFAKGDRRPDNPDVIWLMRHYPRRK